MLGPLHIADVMEEDSHAATQAVSLVASPGEIDHTTSVMDMEEETSALPKDATLLLEKVGYANSTVEARDVG